MEKQKKKPSLAIKMGIALVLGIVAGILFMFLREALNSSGNAGIWKTINNILFQDITAKGATSAIGLFYIIGQMFIRSLQLVIIPMVFTSIALAIGTFSDAKTLGRISFKTISWFLLCYFFALLLAGVVGLSLFHAGFFNVSTVSGVTAASGTAGSNPLLVILNMVPANITTVFGDNTAVLAIVFLAVALGLCMNVLGTEKTATLKKLLQEINDVIVIFLNFVVTKFGPIAIFVLLSRTFATYGINYLKPAFVYVITTIILLLLFLTVGYSLIIWIGTKLNPIIFLKKMFKVMVFAFSTSSSAATLPLNIETTVNELGVHEKIASFVLPLGMTVNMNGNSIMQVIATLFIAGCAGYHVTPLSLIVISLLSLIASVGTPAAPGAGAVILFTILSGVGFTNDGALLAYSLILAINRPIEMLMTTLNVTGDSCTSVYVAKSEGLLNREIYNSKIK